MKQTSDKHEQFVKLDNERVSWASKETLLEPIELPFHAPPEIPYSYSVEFDP